ncbi:MAG: enoyl-CoA hydratase/isomerase family protein [Micrococcales bacterium]|nr:enoyl-CoA hydratase/isomerase family protein [Micrococcales bacterium]
MTAPTPTATADPAGRFAALAALDPDEVVTHSLVRDIPLPSGRTLALLTLDNGRDHTRPSTLGPATLIELAETLDRLAARAAAGEIDAVGITGTRFILAAGADLSKVGQIPDRQTGRQMAELGHLALGKLAELGVPSFCFINGLALGGGVEIGLNSTYRTIDASVPAFALPEVFLGIIPGWGGAWLLPNLIGIENALEVVISNPLKNNRMLKAPKVLELGIVDAMFPPANFLEDSLKWADGVLGGTIAVKRPHQPGRLERAIKWDIAVGVAEKTLRSRIGTVPKSPYRALELLRAARNTDKATGFAAEDEALADLISGDQFRASIYAFNLTQKRAKRPAGAPDRQLARPVTKVGVLGAGLMASQFALLFLRRLQVPVVITDLDQARVDRGLEHIRGEVDALLAKGRIDADEAGRLRSLISGTVDKADFADCDWVIEAVFEELAVKQQVFAEIEKHIAPDAILATNTSSLSVERIGSQLAHPERLVGFHFFNPVAVMPLIEVVRTEQTTDEALSTAMLTAAALKKTAVITRDTPGFVVNRVLAKVLGEAMHAVEQGTPVETVVEAQKPFGLPMDPFVLLELVGLTVGAHVLETHHAAFPDRFFDSAALRELAELGRIYEKDAKGRVKGLDPAAATIIRKHVPRGAKGYSAEELRLRFEDGLADEVHRMLSDDQVVAAPEDIDLSLIMGAGYPFQMGGLTPYLDRVGASERAFGDTFHHPPIRGVA